MKTLFTFICIISCFPSFSQSFTKVTSGDIVNTPSASRSANFVDVNGDGWDDVFISNGPSSGQNNMLYLNNQNGTFSKVTNDPIVQDGSGSDGATFADVDNDGDLDACVVTWHNQINYFYRNQGNGEFLHEQNNIISGSGTYSETASWGDADNDGWLDLCITNSSGNTKNKYFQNNGAGDFGAISSGPHVNDQEISRSVDWIDYDLDGDLDLFVTNESNSKNSLYQNDGAGNFSKITTGPIVETIKTSAGSSWADIDNDGDFDLFVANWQSQSNDLFLNNGDGNFSAVGQGEIVSDNGCSFGSAFADADNDGDLDLYVCNAFCGVQNNFFFINQGDGTFVKETSGAPATDQGWTFGCAWGDYNNDGFLDLVLANTKNENQSNALYQNDGNDNHWFKLNCEGTTCNQSAIGAIIKLKATIDGNPVWQMRRIEGQSGYCSQNSLNVHFGLGDATLIDSLIVKWPSGVEQIFENIEVDKFCRIKEGESIDCTVTSIAEQKKIEERKLIVFPNPVAEEMVIIENPFVNSSNKAVLKVYSQNGQLLKAQNIDNQQERISLNISDLIKAAYQLVLETDELLYSESLIIH